MKISEYIYDRWASIGIAFLTCLGTGVFLEFMETERPVTIAVETVFLIGFFCMLAYDCIRKKQYYDRLEETWDGLDEKSYLSEMIEKPDFYDGKVMYEIVKENGKYLNDMISAKQQEMMEYKEYVQTWGHEIKTPIAVQELIIENNRNPVISSLEEETRKIEAYVEQMLYYTKSGSLESDYIIQPVQLKKLVMEVIRKNKKMMVGAGVMPRLEHLEYEVLADPKWLEFILGQIVTNAVKYREQSRRPFVAFGARVEGGMVVFTVTDNGIGIPKQDITRVFQKGFTGENGRKFKKSTGMGLYLCKDLCRKMEIPLEISSCQGEGTELEFRLKRAEASGDRT
ncbi:MAG: sensor histidine kinase [Blautia sp.]|jgi:signal transduction histidine kinase